MAALSSLRHAWQFLRVRKNSRRFHSRHLVVAIHLRDTSSQEEVLLGNRRRFGIIVSKRVSKKAVDRNRAKRLLREISRHNLSLFPNAADIVFIAKSNIFSISQVELLSELKELSASSKWERMCSRP